MTKNVKHKNDRKNMNINPLKDNNGFTLVEMIVTFLVLGILLAVSVMSLVAWQDWADFNRENEYAETLFLAAQNQLSEYSSNGTLSDFSDRAYIEAYGNKVNLNSIYYAEGKSFTAELNQDNSVWVSKNAGTLCFAMSNKGDYKKYLAGEETDSPTAPIVFELFESYVYDTSILNETICIEFSLEDGQVFSAFYTDKFVSQNDADYEAFEYNNTNDSLRGLVNIATRYESYRKDRMVGYYGVDTLSAALVSKNDKPTIAKISLNNEETLNLSFKLGKYASATNELTYNVSVYDNQTKKKILDIKIDTSAYPLKNYENRETVPCSVIRYSYDESGNAASEELGKLDILAYIDKDNYVRVVLDAADAKATTNLYNEEFDKLFDTSGVIKYDDIKFANTLSFHRFGLNAEEIYCSVQGYSSKYKATSVKQSNSSYVYFANETVGEEIVDDLGEVDHFNYTIKNARHLYNVRYLEDLSAAKLNKYKKTENGTAYITFALIKNIDWKGFVDDGNYYASNISGVDFSKYYKKQNNINIMTDRSFASFGKLRMYDKFIGNDFVVSGLNINEKFNVTSGLYGYDKNTINNIEKPVGLFNENYGLIKTAKLDNIKVTSSSDKVGAFCGVNVAGVLANGDKTGVLNKLTVLNSGINTSDASVILGKEHVGGIVGYLQGVSEGETSSSEFEDVVLSELINNAKVTGEKYVGGIIGEVRTSKTKAIKIIVDECVNKGAVLASNSEVDEEGIVTVKSNTTPTDAKYIGGITGYTANVYANNHDDEDVQELITIRNCVSSPVYSDSDLATLLDDSIDNAANVLSTKLNGVYVGGIVGYNYYSTIQSCTTKADKGKQGYVFGYQYVGGIVGFNQGPTSGIKGGDDNISGVNEANVVGNEYVGGITGCNADVNSDKLAEAANAVNYNPTGKYTNEILEATDIIVIPDIDRNIDNKIENWVNKGIIFATGRYAGGISGYNSGWIFNCNSEVESANVDGFFQSTYSSGDYTGGIAGYNNGVIGNTKRELDVKGNIIISSGNKAEDDRKISAVCYISGKNYVGGIVGYNDVDAIVEDYELAGGYILGDEEDSAFVGGYAGFNSSIRLLTDDNGKARTIVSKPNEVIGEYFVGGSVGGNIINTFGVELPKDSDNNPYIPTVFKTDNFLGTIYGKAFVGGFVGYNMITDTPSLVYNNEDDFEVSYVIQQRIVDAFKISDASALSDNQKLVKKVDILNDNNLTFENVKKSDATMYISGTDNKTTKNSLGRIEADIYIGGVFGYNDDNTYVNVKDVENTTPIIADAAIEYYNEQNGRNNDYAGRDITFTYSYAGGIVGKVSHNMTIDNCSNASSGTVTTLGTYTGGLAEVNEGTIINCEANSFGSSMDEYVGGICGLNKKLGNIKNCNAENITVSGQNVVSGITAENFGTISGVKINKLTLLVSGKNIIDADNGEIVVDGTTGGVAAYNAGTIIINDDINVDISSKGNYAGAVAAVNDGDGIVINGKIIDSIDLTAEKSAYDDKAIKITGNITGITSAGGVIGRNTSDNTENIIAGFSNYAVVTASKGIAGGIIGDNSSGNTIAFCDNHEIVTASNAGNAGGITSSNSSTITKCNNYAEIKAASGMCGGISAVNKEGALISYCKVEPEDKNGKLDFASKDAVGGISATNNGTIKYVNLKNVNVYNYTTSGVSSIGVVTGINDEKGTISFSASSADEKTIDNCTAKTYTNYSFVGGVAGTNKGVISGTELSEAELSDDEISASLPKTIIDVEVGFMPNSATVASMGGVAGVNYNKISNISIVGNVIGNLGGDTVGYGGIAGINGYLNTSDAKAKGYSEYDEKSYTSVISYCTFDGEVFAEGSGAGIARIGGIAGNNGYGGDIENCYLGVRNDGNGVATDGNGGVNQSRVTKIYAGKQEDENGNLTTDIKTESRNAGVTANGKNYGVEIITEAYDKQSYAHIGGMAGTNYGRVRDCDNHEMAKSLKDKHDFDTDAVRIYAFTCVSGGIVGYSYQGSVIEGSEEKGKHISTGDNWDIKARGSDNDRGNGGIVGIYSSSNNINYVDNYADVTCIYKTNPCVGGIAGFINQREVIDLTISNATNHGDILSFQRAGGMVGLLAYSGIRFDHCINYGEVRGLNTGQDNAPAGYIQYAMHITSDIVFMSCYNHGNIVSQTNRGTGYITNVGFTGNTGASLRFIDCVNTGVIGRLAQNDKRIHYADDEDNEIEPDAGNELEQSCGFAFNGGSYTNCRNYANGKIYAFSYNNVNAKDCFDASGTDVASRNPTYSNVFVPFSNLHNNSSAVRNNYYITKNPTESKKEYGVYASLSSGRLIRNEADNTISVPFSEPKLTNRYTYAGNQETNISFDFEYTDESQGMDSLLIYLRDNDTNTSTYRYYSYECILYDESGNELKRFDNGDELIRLSNYNNIEEGLIKIEFGEYAGKTVKKAVLHTKNTDQNGNSINESKFFGFAYVPVANKDTVSYCDVLNENNIIKTDTCMNFKLYKDGYTFRHTDNNNATIASDNIILNDYTQFESSSDVGRWFIEPGTADVYIKAQFDIEYGPNAKGLEKLYLINDTSDGKPKSNNNQYPYYYYAVFTDEDGNVYYDGTDAEPKTITKEELTERHTYIGVEVPESCNKKVVKVEFYFKCAQARRTCINFSGFRWTEKDSDEAMLIPYDSADSYYLNFITAYKTELTKKENGEKISLFPLFVTEEKSDDYSIVLEDNDPWNYDSEKKYYTYFDDKSPYNDLYDVAIDEGGKSWNNNTRVGVFKELDPKFEEFIYSSTYNPNVKLPITGRFWLDTYSSRGKYRIKWNAVANAIGYMTHYSLEDENGN
ncbi:MAG: prepilin-type N-terminal cleavage/methylation domain-containing protein, partial [Lachnospiraceae bacterium]|nr:prepilin-type N-terminal cleavage/methylation domain-containing protein [Lachnospiraceae bacterium]